MDDAPTPDLPLWSVVVVARWNKAIYTPNEISRRLFGLGEAAGVEVGIPMDVVGAFKVKHEGVSVAVAAGRLIVEADEPSFELLSKAMSVAWRAVEHLPHTPFTAAGLNLAFPSGPDVLQLFSDGWDAHLTNAGFPPLERAGGRIVQWREGRISVGVVAPANLAPSIRFNFERRSTEAGALKEWLSIPATDLKTVTDTLLATLEITGGTDASR